MNKDLKTLDDVKHFFEIEILIAEERLKCDSNFFNGVQIDNNEAVLKLNQSHIRFCKDIIKRLEI